MAGPSTLLYGLTLLAISAFSNAHSWVEQMALINPDGYFIGPMGYSRGYVGRMEPGFNQSQMVNLIPSANASAQGRRRMDGTDLLCHPSQRQPVQSQGYPRLTVYPGAAVALKYLENGHVTADQSTAVPGKQYGNGTVFIFGTTQPLSDEKMLNVMQWNAEGTGGDKRGKLLAANDFDDHRCYQISTSTLSEERRHLYPNFPPGPHTNSEASDEQWCETNLILNDISLVQPGKSLTLYWIWEWPTVVGTPGDPYGKDEYYTTCSDVNVASGPPSNTSLSNFLRQQDPQTKAVTDFMSRTALHPLPVIYDEMGHSSTPALNPSASAALESFVAMSGTPSNSPPVAPAASITPQTAATAASPSYFYPTTPAASNSSIPQAAASVAPPSSSTELVHPTLITITALVTPGQAFVISASDVAMAAADPTSSAAPESPVSSAAPVYAPPTSSSVTATTPDTYTTTLFTYTMPSASASAPTASAESTYDEAPTPTLQPTPLASLASNGAVEIAARAETEHVKHIQHHVEYPGRRHARDIAR